jgi:hypothetical protein
VGVRGMISNTVTGDITAVKHFLPGCSWARLEVLMDHGWIRTLGSQRRMTVQISVATEDGSQNTA